MAIEPTTTQLENRQRALQGLPVIDATTLSEQETPTTPATVPPVTTPDISGLDANVPEVLSPVEQEMTTAQKRAMELTGVGAEKEAKRTQLELATPEIEAQRKIQRDIASQLSGLQAEALKETTRAEGRLAPTFAIRGEQAQIERQRAVKALSLSAQLDASQGLLSSALDKIDRAVEAEFGPREAELDTIMKNLEILRSDPRLTREEEKRADARQIAVQKELDKIAEEKQAKKDIQQIAVEASSLGADAVTLREISQATTPQEAMRIAVESGFIEEPITELDTQIVEVGGRKLLVNTQTGETIRDLGASKVVGSDGIVKGLSPVTGKVFTESQSKAGTFAVRIEEANKLLEDLEAFSPTVGKFVPERFKSDERKQFEQAEKNFITAVLRRESGAAIAKEEFNDARDIYIPQVGDDKVTLEQKAEARRIVFQGLKDESVGSYEQLSGSLGAKSVAPQTGTTKSGIKFTVEND